MRYDTLALDVRGAILTIMLNRPAQKNAINGAMWPELLDALSRCENDEDVRVLVITGAGGDFCSGADVSGGSDSRSLRPLRRMTLVGQVAAALHRLTKPSIAKVRGVAVGAGCNLALGCDLVVASSNARFSEIFVRRALSPDFGGSWLLPRMVGLHIAKELAFFGEIVSGEDAARLHLINRAVADEELDGFVDEWARRLASGPPVALTLTKRLLNASHQLTLEAALEVEAASQAVNSTSVDTREAAAAWQDGRRQPRFTGESVFGVSAEQRHP
jgi:enoyl-CoA hydratase/carnithine racemase